jgi:hypothetical protein
VPFADAGGDVAGLLQHGGDHDLAARLDGLVALVVDQAGAEGVAAGEELAARRPAQRRGVAVLEPRAALGQGIDVGRLGVVAAASADVAEADVVGEDEDDVGLAARGGLG